MSETTRVPETIGGTIPHETVADAIWRAIPGRGAGCAEGQN